MPSQVSPVTGFRQRFDPSMLTAADTVRDSHPISLFISVLANGQHRATKMLYFLLNTLLWSL